MSLTSHPSCRTLSDELSRLWRLAILSPGIPTKQRQGVIDQLRALNQTVSVAFVNGALRPWHGLEVAIRLSSINWNADDFQRVLKGEWTQFPVVSSCMAIQLTCQSKSVCVSEWMAMEEGERNDNAAQVLSESPMPLTFHNPHCISFGPHCNIDIHSVCSMIEALNTSGNHHGAMRLTVALSFALVSFYKCLLFEFFDVTSRPVSAKCSLGAAHKIASKPEENGESPMEVETSNEKANNCHVWPEDTILSVTTFAFLFELLSQRPDMADACLAEMRSKLSYTETKSAHSLKFHLGVLGLMLQRLPAPSLHHEVEEYNYECWLTYQLICSSPVDTDLSFLTHLGQQIMNAATPRPIPPSSLSRVIFHHLFKGAPAALSKCLTERQSVGLGAAFHVLGHVNECTVKEVSSSWMLFQYANCRLWAKLAEVVLRSLSDSQELLEKAMGCILQPNGMLGAQSLENMSLDATSLSVLSRLRDVEFIAAKCRVAYCLARSLSEKQGNSIKILEYKTETGNRVPRRESFEMEMPRKIMKSGVDKALKHCAVQIAAHSLWLQKLADRSRVHNETVRWLTDFVVSSGMETVNCLVNCKGDVNTFLAQSELLDLCEKVLRKEEVFTSHGRDIVQGILLSLLQKASQSEASEDMKRIVSFCREKRCATKVDLLPWICKGLQSLADSNAFLPFEVLMDASHGMLEHYKEKLVTTESTNQVLWNQKGALCLGRLFNEGVLVEEDSDNEDGDSVLANRNPFRTKEPHPFLQTAFGLGMMGLEKLKEKPDELLNGRFPHYRRCPVKEHLSEFCRLVCYLVNKTWLTAALTGASGNLSEIKSPMKADKTPSAAVNVKPGCSHWEDGQSQSGFRMSVDSCYLHKFVCSLINGVDNPLWLFEVLQELGDHLCTEVVRSSPTSRQERQNLQIKEACQCYPSVKLLLQRDLDEFSKLLLGPKMSTVVDDVAHRRDRRRLEPSEIMHELGHCQLMNTRLKDVLKTAKRAFSISDSSGSLFKNLTDEITSQHSILQCLVDRVLKDKELCSSDEREAAMFPRASILPALFAQGLFPGLFERSPIEDYF